MVRIFVHPLYEKQRGNEPLYIADPQMVKLVHIEQTLIRLLARPAEVTPPIIIMEEAVYVEKLQEWLKNYSTDCYYVGTDRNNPTPSLGDYSKAESWKLYTDALKELGVQKILMGGMQLEVSDYLTDWTNKKPWTSRCVGIALSYLARAKAGDFDVTLSALTYPAYERKLFIKYSAAGN